MANTVCSASPSKKNTVIIATRRTKVIIRNVYTFRSAIPLVAICFRPHKSPPIIFIVIAIDLSASIAMSTAPVILTK